MANCSEPIFDPILKECSDKMEVCPNSSNKPNNNLHNGSTINRKENTISWTESSFSILNDLMKIR